VNDELISPNDFKTIELVISVSNTTSRTKVGKEAGIKLVEFLEHGFALEVPKTLGAQGHSLIVEFHRADQPEAPVVSVTGKVEKLKKSGEELFRAEISLLQYDEAEWTGFQELFSNRQAEILKFLAAARGY